MEAWTVVAVAITCFGLVVALCRSKPLARPLMVIAWGAAVFTAEAGLGDAGTSALSAPKLLPAAALTVFGAWAFIRAWDDPERPLTRPLRWLVQYVAWLAVCSLFSPDPISAALRMVQIAVPLFAIIAARRLDQKATGFVIATVVACAAHVFYGVFVEPDYVGFQGEQRLTGLLIANGMGLAGGLALAGALGAWLGRTRPRAIAPLLLATVGVSAYALVEAAARTATIAVLVALLAAIFAAARADMGGRIRRRAVVAAAAIVGATIYTLLRPKVYASFWATVQDSNSALGTLTGRTPLWEHLVPAIADRFLFGYGPAAFRDGSPALADYLSGAELRLASAHNAFLEALVAGGLPGGLLWLGVMIAVGLHCWRSAPSIRPVAVALFAVSAISAMTTSGAAGIGIGWYMLLALAALPTAATTRSGDVSAREQATTLRA